MGSVIAMVAVVSVIAGLATATTNKLHGVFTGGVPKEKGLQRTLEEWRSKLVEVRRALVRLKPAELDLLALAPSEDRKLLKARNRKVGFLQTIYGENVAAYVRQEYPRAKEAQSMTLVQTVDREYVFRQRGERTFLTIDGGPAGSIYRDALHAVNGAAVTAALVPQRDERTVHLDRGERTLAILVRPGVSRQVVPRAYALVDLQQDDDRRLLEAMTAYFLLNQNSDA